MDRNIPYILVYPSLDLRDEYLQRYKDRGSPDSFINLLKNNWNNWVDDCDRMENSLITKIKLQSKEFLGDNHKIKNILK